LVTRNDIDERIIKLNGVQKKVVFDTGASENILCKGDLKDLPNVKIIPNIKEYRYFDGGCGKTIGTAKIMLEYKGNFLEEVFNVVNRNVSGNILVCNTTVKKLSEKKSKIPIECCINTGDSEPISWTRPIRSMKDKIDFECIIAEL
jgi:hypothetical protein